MLEFFGLLLKLFYLSIAMIFYTIFNLFASAGAYHQDKDMPGNDFIFVSAVCALVAIPMLFSAYPAAIVTWVAGLVSLFIGSKKNHEASDEFNPTFYFINLTFGVLIAVFMIVLFSGS